MQSNAYDYILDALISVEDYFEQKLLDEKTSPNLESPSSKKRKEDPVLTDPKKISQIVVKGGTFQGSCTINLVVCNDI